MLKGLTRAGIGNIGSEAQFISLAAAYGFEAVDLDVITFVEQEGLDQAKGILQEHHIMPGAIELPVEWRTTEEEFRAGLPKLATAAKLASELGSTACCTYILPSTDLNPAHFMTLATRRLRICAEILGAYRIRLGLEFVGPHHLRTTWKHPFIWTMQETLDWIDAINVSNVGLLLDTYHTYTTNLTEAELGQLRAEQIVHVHLNDAPDLPVEQVLDKDRLYPGEGVIDLHGFLQTLQQINYKGIVAQEVLTPHIPAQSPGILLQRSKQGFDKVFQFD